MAVATKSRKASVVESVVGADVGGKEVGSPIRDKFAAARKALRGSLIERNDEIDVTLAALVCQEHVLFVGEPGTAKSLLANSVCEWIGGNYFHCLVGRFTTTEELFGPISLKGLKDERYVRVTENRLPEAEIAFIDEIFKSSSAILNTLLQVLNERTFFNGGKNSHCPLRLCVAASNEWPGEKELGALFDRFLFRKNVRGVGSSKGLKSLLWNQDLVPKIANGISVAEVDQAHEESSLLEFGKDARDCLETIYRRLQGAKVQVGDRRLRKAVSASKAAAWLAGSDSVEPEHLAILAHVLWSQHEQAGAAADIVAEFANPSVAKVRELTSEIATIISTVQKGSSVGDIVAADRKLAEIQKAAKKLSCEEAGELETLVTNERARIRGFAVE